MRIWALVVVLMLSLLPTMEVIEAAVHVMEFGDLGHDSHDKGHDLGTDEHGCSGTFHLCGCHTANVIPPAVSVAAVPSIAPGFDLASFDMKCWIGRGAAAPPIRPPIV